MNDVLMKADLTDLSAPKFEKIKKNLGDVSKGSNILQGAFGDLKNKAESLGTPLGKMEQYFGKINPAILGGVAAVGALTGGIVALALNAAKVGAGLEDLRDQTGMSVESLSSMRTLVQLGGIDLKTYAESITKLSINLGKSGEDFKKWGIDIQDPEKAFDQIKRKFVEIQNPIERAKLGNAAFGKSFKDLTPLLMMANDEYDKIKGNTNVFSSEFAANAAKVDDNILLLKTTFSDFAIQLGANFLPMMESLVGILSEAADFWGSLAKGPDKQVKRAADMEAISKQYDGVQAESDKGSKVLGQSSHRIKINGKTKFEALQEYQAKVRAEDKLEEERLAKEKAEREAKRVLTGMFDDKEKKGRDTSLDKYQGQNYDIADLHNDSSYGGNGSYTEQMKRSAEFIENSKKEQLSSMAQLQAKAAELNISYGMFDDREALTKKIEASVKATDELKLSTEEYKRILDSLSGAVQNTLAGPFDSFFKRVGSGNKSMENSFKSLFTDIGDNFGNMLTGMMSQLLAKAAVFGLLNILSGGGVGTATTALKSFSWFAGGTDYTPGGMAIVGERGPEAVYLPRGSKVVPNKQISNYASSPTYNVTINGVDRSNKELEDLTARSFKTIEKRNAYRRAR